MASELEPCYSLVWHAAHSFDNNEKNRKLMACHAKSHVSDVSKMVSKKLLKFMEVWALLIFWDFIFGSKELELTDIY